MSKVEDIKDWQYWIVGWIMYLRHPIKKPIDHAKAAIMLSQEKK